MFWVSLAAAAPVAAEYTPGAGFGLVSEDGRFGLRVRSRIQLLGTVRSLDDAAPVHGFDLRRVRLALSGHGFGKWNRWAMQLGFSNSDLGGLRSPLLDLWWELAPDAPVRLVVGQMKVPLSRARIGSTATLQLVDRHSVDAEFTLDRDRGALVVTEGWDPDGRGPRACLYTGVFQGDGRDAALFQTGGVAPLARVELTPLGAFAFHEDGDLARSQRFLVGLGAGALRLWNAPRDRGGVGEAPADGGTTHMTMYVFDLGLRWRGLSFEASAAGRTGKREVAGVPLDDQDPPRNGLGWVVQGGAMLPRVPVGVAGRYASIRPAGNSSLPESREIAGATSWFIEGHAYDLTADFAHLVEDDVGSFRGRLQLELAL
ncbi:MAG: hypothetical protein H6737_30490 [Alphaproteobacteria bacterium]|nr:hypothetical protein [Alphaproteobacteria bacterium]